MISKEQIDYVPGHLEYCNMLNDVDIDNEPIPVEATVDLRTENMTTDSVTLNAQMYSSPNTALMMCRGALHVPNKS